MKTIIQILLLVLLLGMIGCSAMHSGEKIPDTTLPHEQEGGISGTGHDMDCEQNKNPKCIKP